MTNPREMQAGEKLDELIHQEVMGNPITSQSLSANPHDWYPKYSSDPAASAELRAKLWEQGISMRIDWCHGSDWKSRTRSHGLIPIVMVRTTGDINHLATGTRSAMVAMNSDPVAAECLAIAHAALLAVRARKGAKC